MESVCQREKFSSAYRKDYLPNSLKTIWSLVSMRSLQETAQNQIFNLRLGISNDKYYMEKLEFWGSGSYVSSFQKKSISNFFFLLALILFLFFTPIFNNGLSYPSLCQELAGFKEDKDEKSLYLTLRISYLVIKAGITAQRR